MVKNILSILVLFQCSVSTMGKQNIDVIQGIAGEVKRGVVVESSDGMVYHLEGVDPLTCDCLGKKVEVSGKFTKVDTSSDSTTIYRQSIAGSYYIIENPVITFL